LAFDHSPSGCCNRRNTVKKVEDLKSVQLMAITCGSRVMANVQKADANQNANDSKQILMESEVKMKDDMTNVQLLESKTTSRNNMQSV
jgi:hypothetical protein